MLIIVTFMIILTRHTYGQTDFEQWVQKENNYFDSLISIHGIDSMEGTGYEQFQNLYWMWAPRLMPNDSFSGYVQQLKNSITNYSPAGNGTGGGPVWYFGGPAGTGSTSIARFTGQIHYIKKIKIDEINGNTYLAASPTGGLFRIDEPEDTWYNAGTDKGLPKCGVSSVAVLNNIWYVTTGYGEDYLSTTASWQLAIGVYRSKNKGKTWENIGLNEARHMRKAIGVNADSSYLVVTTSNGLWETTNADDSDPTAVKWVKLIDGEFYDVISSPDSSYVIYASGSHNIGVYKVNLLNHNVTLLRSMDDFFDSNIQGDDPDFSLRRVTIKIAPANHKYLYCIYSMRSFNNLGLIYRYDISQNQWSKRGETHIFNGYARNLGWDIRPDTTSEGYIQIYGRNANKNLTIYIDSLDNEQHDYAYLLITKSVNFVPHADCHFLMFEDNNTIWSADDGGICVGTIDETYDTLITWQYKILGLGVANINKLDVSNDKTIATSGQFDCGSYMYDQISGNSWWNANKRSGGDGYQTVIKTDNDYFVSSQYGFISHYFNGSLQTFSPGSYFNSQTGAYTNYANFETYYQLTGNDLFMSGTKDIIHYTIPNTNWSFDSQFSDGSIYPEMGEDKSGTWQLEIYNNNIKYCSTYGNNHGYNYFEIYKYTGNSPQSWKKVGGKPATPMGWISTMETGYSPNTDLYAAVKNKIFLINVDNNNLDNSQWTDITYDLPQNVLYINKIFYDNQTDKIFIATDNGVYYKKRNQNNWVLFSNNLPNVNVKDIKVVDNTIYAGTYGRGIWYASSPVCEETGDTVHIFQNTTYNTDQTVYDDIFIHNGATLTVTGTLKMGASAKIIVDRGAELFINGGTLTKACPDMWPGIEVWGNSNAAQNHYNQGYVILKNNARIEYAVTAIATIKNDGSTSHLDFAGGVIQADSSTFANNITDVRFFPYPENYSLFALGNISYFKYCMFVSDNDYFFLTSEQPIHVELNDVTGLTFQNNTFQNTNNLSYISDDDKGIGISAWNAGFVANNISETGTGNKFSNLCYGIKTLAYEGKTDNINIDGNLFEHNKTGIYLGAETFASVIRNTFNITRLDSLRPDGYCGLYLDACTGYQVEENEFYSDYDPQFNPAVTKSYGLVVNNSGPEDNFIYNNNFHNISWALQAQNQNRGYGHPAPGLHIKCNDFSDNWQDISVTYSGYKAEYFGIAEHQGSAADTVTAPAGNRFSQLGKTLYSDYDNEGENIIYHLPNQSLGLTYPIIPKYYTTQTIQKEFNNILTYWNPIDGCPSNLTSKSYVVLTSSITAAQSSATVYSDSLSTLVDAGNTTGTNLDVVTSMPPETMQLRDELLNASPFLSDTVMVSAAGKENVLPNSIVTEVLTANPQSAKSDKVLNKLNERNNPPNDNQMAQIHANDTVVGHKESLESKKAYYAGEKANAVYDLVRMYGNDTAITAKSDSIEAALAHIHTPASMYQQAFCRLNRGDSAGVLNLLNNIPSEFDLNSTETDYHNYFTDFFTLLLTLQSQQKPVTQIDSTQKVTLYDMMDNTKGLLHAYTRSLLIYSDGLEYHEPYILPDTSSTKSAKVKTHHDVIKNKVTDYLKLYPNPAENYITIEYKMPYGYAKAIIEIVDITGIKKEIYRLSGSWGEKIVDLRSYNTGAYVIRLWGNNKLLQSKKFTKL